MISEPDLIKILNLLRTQPGFVVRERPGSKLLLASPKIIPDCDGFYWVAGTTFPKVGNPVPSVFVVDTDSAGEQHHVYWFHNGCWYDPDSFNSLASILGTSVNQFYPFAWDYHVPLANDVHR